MKVERLAALVLGIFLFFNPVALADSVVPNNIVSLNVTLVNQDPYPAEPGEYVSLVFKVENEGLREAENVVFELVPEYPFSLDYGVNGVNDLGTINGMQGEENAYLIKYKVRVDKDAIDGENEIEIKYTYGSGGSFHKKVFYIEVSDPKTAFEVVMEDYSEDSTTFAIANIGTNTAYSLIVKVPEQEGYSVTGSSADIIGNLDAGDYTLTSFQISSAASGNRTVTAPGGFKPRSFNEDEANEGEESSAFSVKKEIKIELSYTDELGIRRTMNKQVTVDMTSSMSTGFSRSSVQEQTSSGGDGLMYIGVGMGGIAAIAVGFSLLHRKRKPKE